MARFGSLEVIFGILQREPCIAFVTAMGVEYVCGKPVEYLSCYFVCSFVANFCHIEAGTIYCKEGVLK